MITKELDTSTTYLTQVDRQHDVPVKVVSTEPTGTTARGNPRVAVRVIETDEVVNVPAHTLTSLADHEAYVRDKAERAAMIQRLQEEAAARAEAERVDALARGLTTVVLIDSDYQWSLAGVEGPFYFTPEQIEAANRVLGALPDLPYEHTFRLYTAEEFVEADEDGEPREWSTPMGEDIDTVRDWFGLPALFEEEEEEEEEE